jgi:hypothetical protein
MADEDIKINSGTVGDTQAGVDVDKTPEVKPEVDLVTKVSSFKPAEETQTESKNEEDVFNVNDIDKIEDPQAREYALKAYKSLQRGFNQKFQYLAELRKEFEAKKADTSTWSPEKVQSLLEDKSFVEAAQRVAGVTQQEEVYSALSDDDKKRLYNIQAQMQSLANQNASLLKKQQDENLKSRYANYDNNAVDILSSEFLSGKRPATREDVWKIKDYDSAVKRAYEMGRQDVSSGISEKESSVSTEGYTVSPKPTPPAKEEKESDGAYFKRLVLNNLQKQARASK